MWKTPGNGLNTRFFAENRLHIGGNFAISQNGIAKFFCPFLALKWPAPSQPANRKKAPFQTV
jgi:hypothetical protein